MSSRKTTPSSASARTPVQIRDGDVGEPGQVLHEARQAERPDHQPDGEEAEHRSYPKTMEQWHDDASSGEEDQRLIKN